MDNIKVTGFKSGLIYILISLLVVYLTNIDQRLIIPAILVIGFLSIIAHVPEIWENNIVCKTCKGSGKIKCDNRLCINGNFSVRQSGGSYNVAQNFIQKDGKLYLRVNNYKFFNDGAYGKVKVIAFVHNYFDGSIIGEGSTSELEAYARSDVNVGTIDISLNKIDNLKDFLHREPTSKDFYIGNIKVKQVGEIKKCTNCNGFGFKSCVNCDGKRIKPKIW